MLLAIDLTLALHRAADHLIEVLSGLIIWRDDEGRIRVFRVLVRDRSQSLLAPADFMNAALVIELFDSASHLTARQLFNDRFQLVVFLPHDLIESRGVDTSVLELLIRSAGIQRFVLPHVSAEQHAVLRSETAEERVHLCRAGQAGFIEHVAVLVARQMPLQRIRLDADLGQLVGGTGGRREALDLIALTFGCVANRRERRRLPGAGGAFERHERCLRAP